MLLCACHFADTKTHLILEETMHQLFYTGLEAAAASILLVPLFLYLNKLHFHSRKNTLLYTLFAVYLAGVYAVAGLPNVRYFRFDPNFNFVPFLYMFSDLSGTILNVILFIPLGFFLAVLWKPFRNPVWNTLFGLGISLVIEFLQIFTFRATDVNDLMTNTLGTLIGWVAGHCARKNCTALVCDNAKRDLAVVFGATFCVMFFAHPFLSGLMWRLID